MEDELETLKLLLGGPPAEVSANQIASKELEVVDQQDDEPRSNDLSEPEIDQRSKLAMEELSNMMLKMGVDEQGEPSFTIPSSGRRPRERSGTGNTQIRSTAVELLFQNHKTQYLDDIGLRHLLYAMFMENFNPYHWFIYPESTPILLDTLFTEDQDMQFYGCALCAIGARFLDWPNRIDISRQFQQYAEAILVSCLRDFAGEATVKALCLLAWVELADGNDSMAFSYNCKPNRLYECRNEVIDCNLAMATGMILMLGYHVTALDKTPSLHSDSNNNIISRIKTFWSYFSIDRYAAPCVGDSCRLITTTQLSIAFQTMANNT